MADLWENASRPGALACVGEWRSRGKAITILEREGLLVLEMGPEVPTLVLLPTSEGAEVWPMQWTAVRSSPSGGVPESKDPLYILELPTPTSVRLLVKRPVGDGVAEERRHREKEAEVWEEFDGLASPNFFNDITIAPDGGFSEVGDLWYQARWATAVITVFFLLSNVGYNLCIDYVVLTRHLRREDKVHLSLISQAVFNASINVIRRAFGLEDIVISGCKLVAGMEMLLMFYMMFAALRHTYIALTTKCGRQRWIAAEHVWWDVIPDLYTYSAMRLLHYVSPQVLVNDVSMVCSSATACKTYFVASRLVCLVIGFDSFVVKCRESKKFMEPGDFSLASVWAGLIFLKQVLGIVQVGMFVRDRLFTFIFAGEDGRMQRREVSLRRVWNAMLVREIFRKFSLSQAVVIMFSFDDNDFQKLVLNDRYKGRDKVFSSTTSETGEESDSGL